MEMLRESAPFLIGMVLPVVTLVLVRLMRLDHFKVLASFVLALIVGCSVSWFAGELAGSPQDGIMALIIDTSLVYTGSQLTYHLLWKPVLEERLARKGVASVRATR